MIDRRLAVVALSALLLAGACGGGDDGAGDDGGAGAGSVTTTAGSGSEGGDDDAAGDAGGDAGGDAADSAAASASGGPCAVVTQQQWETLFGAGVQKSEASGGADNCNVLTSGTSPGHEISFVNFSANLPGTTFDDQVGYNPPCGSSPATELTGVGDRAVIDTSCLALVGNAWVLAETDGDVVGLFFEAGEPATVDAATAEATLTDIATEALAAR